MAGWPAWPNIGLIAPRSAVIPAASLRRAPATHRPALRPAVSRTPAQELFNPTSPTTHLGLQLPPSVGFRKSFSRA